MKYYWRASTIEIKTASHREYVVGCLYDEEGKEHAAQQCKCRKGVSPYRKMCFQTTGIP